MMRFAGFMLLALCLFQGGPAWAGETDGINNQSIAEGAQILEKSMMNNEAVMELILSLQNNPDFQKILQDKAIMRAVNAGDIAALLSNPTFHKILNNPAIGQIKNELGK